jgi:hypothetical protein
MKIDNNDPFLENADEWKNQSSWGNISILTYEKPYLFEDENIIKNEIDITCHGLSKEEFEQWKSSLINRPDIVRNFENKVIISSFNDG